MKRIGIALTKPQSSGRQNEYGIYESDPIAYGYPVIPQKYVKYEGYRLPDGTQVGLPLAGPNADHLQTYGEFHPGNFAEVRFFKSPN
jgi:hypothetical protein